MSKSRKRPLPAPAAATPAPLAPAASPSAAPQWRRHLLILIGLWIAVLLVYSNSFQAGLTFDNGVAIQQDPRIRSLTSDNLRQIFTEEYWYPSMTIGLYRPLTTLSFLFNYAVLGNAASPAGYHVVNYLLHAINIAMVYFLALLLLEETSWAWLLAALWALHPLLTESITNIVGRADELAALGVVAGLLCHIHASKSAGRAKLAWLAGLVFPATIAVFSKESGVVLVAVMLCYDLTFGKSSAWISRLGGYAAVLLPAAVFFSLRASMLDHTAMAVVPFVDNPLVGASTPTAILIAAKVIGKYLWLFLWPIRLSCDYSYNQIPLRPDLAAFLSLAICLVAAALAFRAWQRGKALPAFAIAFFFATLAPTSNVLLRVGSIMAERWMYLPSLGLAIAVVLGLQSLHRRLPTVSKSGMVAAALVLCLAWSARTYVRNFDWRDEQSLWQSAADTTPESFKASSILANLLATSPQPSLDLAIHDAERSTAILDPLGDEDNIARPFAVEGMCYRLKGDSLSDPAQKQALYGKALDALRRAKRIDIAGRDQLNRVNMAHGKGQFQTGLALLYLELGRVQRRLTLRQPALESLDYGRSLSPLPEFSEEKSLVFQDAGNNDEAAVALLEGMLIDRRSKRLAGKVVQFYKQTAPLTCAVETQGGNSAFNLQCPLVHGHVCEAARNVASIYRNSGRMDLAAATVNTAVSGLGCAANLVQ
jgi:protein O-mannosyl-transferase